MNASDNWSGGGQGGYGGQDPYAGGHDPYAAGQSSASGGGPYAGGQDPYAVGSDPYGSSSDPYATNSDPLAAPVGFAPEFGQGPAYIGQPGPYAPSPPSSGTAIAGFVVGLVGYLMCAGVLSPVGLLLSILGMRDTSPQAMPPKGGRGLAISGLVINILGLLTLIGLVLYVVFIVGLVAVSESS
ncbi:DUF4190 domain-containing protein [Brachybacterium sp. J144]|uniref:DUF4190 domain-containing protein n=1 Tax=Brachybacterium sp. J144 TaxID=3116487 RepID=UPI002E78EB95|nr:DUF4190 domain-containing protein [Brachybacterium sp. J144]MEE1650907.1 DUF4190 domain-containing protein [Brachybacterium sp. J144]